ncbi:MAG: cytochrome c biogenesis protein ResB [Bacteroidales bacterium]|nr:cytochrome c biogenesis protein ResB [Bacteroidales bacterium]MDD3430927.1 cytochrome c biogenesis protein ResB [Bacteroidales bacterium]MDD4360862.1 cytochrome c biogenesis protein ResB [Bacteroidales bacterium]MDD4430423.1 cytochrome c biogenesis protein ResB [Bacteroidales bacterium]
MKYLFSLLGILSLCLQVFTGLVPLHLFAFPTNLLVLLLMLYLVWMNYRFSLSKGKPISLASSSACVIAITGLLSGMLIMGLFPQTASWSPLPGENNIVQIVAYRLGFYSFSSSWIFAFILLYFLTVLAAVIFRRGLSLLQKLKLAERRSRAIWTDSSFVLNHLGLWLAVLAGFLGSSDEIRSKMIIDRHELINVAYKQPNGKHFLPFYLGLKDFKIQYHSSGEIIDYRAELWMTESKESAGTTASLRVNHPLRYKTYDIYLSTYDVEKGEESEYVVLLLIRQPWKKLMYSGIIMMVLGALFLFISTARNLKKKSP